MRHIYLLKAEPEKIFALLGNKLRPNQPTEPCIIGAYQMLGELGQAMEYTQAAFYEELVTLIDYIAIYFSLCPEDKKEECLKRFRKFAEAFSLDQLLPHKTVSIYYAEAVYYAAKDDREKAFGALSDYVHVVEHEWKNFNIHGDDFFDRLEDWITEYRLDARMPRDARLVCRDLVTAVTDNPAFVNLREEPRFHFWESRLKTILSEDLKQKDSGSVECIRK